MSHTTRINGTSFIHNSDYSGGVTITVPRPGNQIEATPYVVVDESDLSGFYYKRVRDACTRAVSELSTQELMELAVFLEKKFSVLP